MIDSLKSELIPRVILLVFGAVSLLPVATGARTQPTPRTPGPAITSGPRAWALATTAFLTYNNRGRIDMLSPDARNHSNVAEMRGLLHDQWGVDNRSGLLRALEWIESGRIRLDFQKLGQSLVAMTDARYKASLFEERNRPYHVRLMKLTREHFRKYRGNSVVAWDYGRYIMLCRWGYMLGFLTEDEAWRRIMPAARTIQRSFRSWDEFGEDYLVGREFWSPVEMDKSGGTYRDIQKWLRNEPQSPWNQLPWRMELGPGVPSRRR